MSDSRDYYADLELPASADDSEIKKQFRKLALKYHPDRNPGREDEVRPKFQIIQKAHEILSDPAAKGKYDATRSRSGGRYPTSSGVRGNPWQNAASNFPPPPRRNAGTTGGRTAASGSASGGAQRWQTRFAQGVPPTAKQYQSADQKTKENAAKAFENMRKAQGAGAKKSSRPTEPPPMPPRSATARQRAEASFGTRKTSAQARPPSRGDHHTFAEGRPVPDPLGQFREAKTPGDSRQRMPYTSHGGEKTDPRNAAEKNAHDASPEGVPGNETVNADASQAETEGPSMYASPSSTASPMGYRITPKKIVRTPSGKLFGQNNLPQIYKSENPKMPSGINGDLSEASIFEKQQHDVLSMLIDKKNAGFASSNTVSSTTQQPDLLIANQESLSFNFEVNDDTFVRTSPQQANFGKTSLDDINTQFSQHQPDTWKFSAGHSGAEQPGAESPSKNAAATAAEPDGTAQEADEGFNATGWADKFGPQTFAPQANAPNNPSPTKTSRANSKKSKSGRSGNAGTGDGTSDDDIYEWNGRKTQKDGLASSPQAMEIDSPPTRPGGPARSNSVRNIPVEPSRPEWRSGNFENVPPAVPPRQSSPIKPTMGGSEDSEEFVAANFSDMKNVPPFAQAAPGLKSFMDLKDNLPFDSQAAPESPSKVPKAQPLIFPPPPSAPRLTPTVAVEGMKPTPASWNQYLEEFERYLAEWESFNAKVVDHFAARNSQIAKMRAEKGYSFLGSRRDGDCLDYYNWIEQDNDVRRRWNAACEGHEMHFRDLMAFREKMKQ